MNKRRWLWLFLLVCLCPALAWGGEKGKPAFSQIDTFWVLISAFLVFFMQAGFGMVEAGLIRAKNTANILMKNICDFSVASLAFFMFGYALMFGGSGAFFGTQGWFLIDAKSGATGIPMHAFWLFQAVFVGAAATIVAGGMAERMKFSAYLIYSFILSGLIYPIAGHWVWGGGWLSKIGFFDFAGSTVVHGVGGMVALVGTMLLGPRLGKYRADGSVNFIAGHNIPLVALGVFILWLGWFGFNPGSTLGFKDPALVARIAINTNLAAAMGAMTAMIAAWGKFGKPDLAFTLNGALAGLVAITASCAVVTPGASIYIGIIAGLLCVFGVVWLDHMQIDDPVGAVPVHGFNGIWGTLAVGLWGQKITGKGATGWGELANGGLFYTGSFKQLGIQALGLLAMLAFVSIAMWIVFKTIDATVGLRVSREDELQGLDIGEHGMESYSGFQIFITK